MGDEIELGGTEGKWATITEMPVGRGTPIPGLSTDVAFNLLSRRHRRFVLYCLRRHDRGIDLPGLADNIARLSEESSTGSALDHERLRTRLTHTTLPRLADAGVVVYDRDANVIWPTEALASMGPLLEVAATLDFDSELPALENCYSK